MVQGDTYDLLVIGGGINGAGIACDAAGRGLSVLLCEAGDLAGATSSASSKLIHGGLRYLEHYQFRLVRESLMEREVMLDKAPHIVRPMRFILPHVAGMRPAWMLRAGLFLYDHLYRRRAIAGSSAIDLATDRAGAPLRDSLRSGFYYWDCWVDDARLVVFNALAAADRGARIRVRTEVLGAEAENGLWKARLRDHASGTTGDVRARAIVNAAGPWAGSVARRLAASAAGAADNSSTLRLVKGSHIVVRRIAGADDAYILQNEDQRVVFVLPFGKHFSLIGTTDVPFDGDPAAVAIDAGERDYLIDVVGRLFKTPPTASDIVWSYAGVRPLFDSREANPSEITRDYRLEMTNGAGQPAVLSVFGGKITTYRKLAEQVLGRLASVFPDMGPAWTAGARLPGGELNGTDMDGYVDGLAGRYPGLDPDYLDRLTRRHGSLTDDVLGDTKTMSDLGADFGGGLKEREVEYLRAREWARAPDDVLWRRTKAGLHMTPEQRQRAADSLAALL